MSRDYVILNSWLAIRFARKKPHLLFAVHTTKNKDIKDELADRFLYQWLMRSCQEIICVCSTQEAHWTAKFPFLKGRTSVIHNGVDPTRYDPSITKSSGVEFRKRYGIPEGAFAACCIAGFRIEKGHDVLIAAFERVIKQYPEAYLLLAGDGTTRAKIETLVHDEGMHDRVMFLGSVGDVRPLLAAADISVIASRAESF